MTKPKEKTYDELTAEIEENEKKIRQYQNRENTFILLSFLLFIRFFFLFILSFFLFIKILNST